MTLEERAEKCRRELDGMPYYEGTLKRDACIQRHIEEAVEQTIHRPALEGVAGAELQEADLVYAEELITSIDSDSYHSQSDANDLLFRSRILINALLIDRAFLVSVIRDEAQSSAREVRNVAFVSGAMWIKKKIYLSVVLDCGGNEKHSAVIAVADVALPRPGEAEG